MLPSMRDVVVHIVTYVQDKPFLPPPFVDLPIGMTPLQIDRFLREQRLEELQRKLQV